MGPKDPPKGSEKDGGCGGEKSPLVERGKNMGRKSKWRIEGEEGRHGHPRGMSSLTRKSKHVKGITPKIVNQIHLKE